MLRFVHHDRNLMRTERSLDLLSVYNLWSCPSLWSTKYNHWPLWSCGIVVFSCILLDRLDFVHNGIKRLCHLAVHGHWIIALYKIWFPSASIKEMLKFFMRNTRKNGWITDLISIQMKDRKNRSIALRI